MHGATINWFGGHVGGRRWKGMGTVRHETDDTTTIDGNSTLVPNLGSHPLP